jgi:hypothetical protein
MIAPVKIIEALIKSALSAAYVEQYGIQRDCRRLIEVYSDYLQLNYDCVSVDKKTTILNKY